MRTVARSLRFSPLRKVWLLTVLPSTAELSKTLTGVFLPGTQAGLVAGVPVLILTPLKLRSWGLCRGNGIKCYGPT